MTGRELSIRLKKTLDEIEVPLNIHKPLYDTANRFINIDEEIDVVGVSIGLMLEVEREAATVISDLMTCLTHENIQTLDQDIFANIGHILRASTAKEQILNDLMVRRLQ